MKPRNLYLGLKDQMPLSRFIRNLKVGHVLGLFSERSHLNKDGKPKVMYNTKETAIRVAKEMGEKRDCYFSNYKCLFCDGYHIGRNRDNK